MRANKYEFVGLRFGKLVTREEVEPAFVGKTAKKHRRFRCECDCGGTTIAFIGNLRRGHTVSCGCARYEYVPPNKTHGLTGTREFSIWHDMQRRCHDPRRKYYNNYGGRGIKVCDEWRGPNGFQAFLDHVGKAPTRKHELDRIDNNGNYEPGNVRWATRKQNCQNRRKRRCQSG
jgi:hypothetical protein